MQLCAAHSKLIVLSEFSAKLCSWSMCVFMCVWVGGVVWDLIFYFPCAWKQTSWQKGKKIKMRSARILEIRKLFAMKYKKHHVINSLIFLLLTKFFLMLHLFSVYTSVAKHSYIVSQILLSIQPPCLYRGDL